MTTATKPAKRATSKKASGMPSRKASEQTVTKKTMAELQRAEHDVLMSRTAHRLTEVVLDYLCETGALTDDVELSVRSAIEAVVRAGR